MSAKIQGIDLMTVTTQKGFRGRKEQTEEVLCLRTTGGDVILPQSAVEGAGDSWRLLTRRMRTVARDKGLPFQDLSRSE